jgi:lipoprotein-releasing system permease protein
MTLPFTFAWRYFKAKKKTNAITIISWITASVIAFSTMCQVLVLSVFNGFEDLVKSLYSNFYADVRIIPVKGKTISLSGDTINIIRRLTNVKDISLVVEEKALIQNGEIQTAVMLKGVDNNYQKVSGVAGKMLRGTFETGDANRPFLVLGAGIENAIDVEADKSVAPITVFLPKRNIHSADPISTISEGNAYTSGSFAIQQEFDDGYVITNLPFVKQQMNYGANEYGALEIKLKDSSKNQELVYNLKKLLGSNYLVQTRYEQNPTLYNSMRLEKWAVFAILTLILIIAAFNMISALTMLVLEKKKDISVLQSLGASRPLILRIFLSEGMLLASFGAIIGIVMAILIGLAQIKYKFIKLNGNSFLIDYFPVKFIMTDFLLVTTTAFLIAFIASWLPARKASGQMINLRND